MSDNTLKGKRILGTARPPKATSEQRYCAKGDCETLLSRYNRREFATPTLPLSSPVSAAG